MAHMITEHNGKSCCFSARELPWHGLGTVLDTRLNVGEALHVANLDWTVEAQPIYYNQFPDAADGAIVTAELPDRVATVRAEKMSDGTRRLVYLGTVSKQYQIFQNKALADLVETMTGTGAMVVETAGSIKSGRVVWILCKLPGSMVPTEQIDKYFLVTNSHDGSAAVRLFFSPVRVVCNNTLSAAMRGVSAQEGVTIHHRGILQDKAREAAAALGLITEAYDDLGKRFARLMETDVQYEDIRTMAAVITRQDTRLALLSRDEDHPSPIDQLETVYNTSQTARTPGARNLWTLYNAFTEFIDHGRARKMDERRFANLTMGTAAGSKSRALAVCEAYADGGLTAAIAFTKGGAK
jgi:phage/plasmid-like protein (TIGR03299 family)